MQTRTLILNFILTDPLKVLRTWLHLRLLTLFSEHRTPETFTIGKSFFWWEGGYFYFARSSLWMSKHELILYFVIIIVLILTVWGECQIIVFRHQISLSKMCKECLKLHRRNLLNLVHVSDLILGEYTFPYQSVFFWFLSFLR